MPDGLVASINAVDPVAFGLVVALTVAGAAAGFYLGFKNLRRARLIEDTPTSRIRSAPQGYVELQGTGEMMDGVPVVSPLSGRPCLWWHYKIEKRTRSGRSSNKWRTVSSETSDALFLLRDQTGSCVVDPEGAEVLEATSSTWHGGRDDRTPRMKRWGGNYRYTQRLIPAASELFAIGRLTTHAGAASWDTAEETRELLAAWKRDQPALVARFDADGDGRIDLDEWENARQSARDQIEHLRREQAAAPGLTVLGRPADGRPYVLAAAPQQRLARRYRWRTAGGLCAFFLSGTSALYLMATRFT